MTFLEICKRLHLILRIGEGAPGSQPVAVTAQDGVLAELVGWVQMANDDIVRNSEFWKFMTKPHTFTLPLDGRVVTLATLLGVNADYKQVQPFVNAEYSFLLSRAASEPEGGEQEVVYLPWQSFHGHSDIAPLSTGQPRYFTVNPNGDIEFDSKADRAYVMRSAYQLAPAPLVNNADVSQIPSRFHMTIVWWAVRNYYCVTRDSTQELSVKATAQLNRELTALRNSELPIFLSGA